MLSRAERLEGLLLGGAIGDALGLPGEGLSRQRLTAWWPGELQHRLLPGCGLMSDDTEHAFMTGQALLKSGGEVGRFERSLAAQLRWWMAALPAGVGLATARATLRLWLGVPPARSGVRSAGNGPAMRSPLIGAVFANQPEQRQQFVHAATRLTHVDPRAGRAALAVAESAAAILRQEPAPKWLDVPDDDPDAEWRRLGQTFEENLRGGATVDAFAQALGLERGVSGYAYHTVPIALYAWQRHRGDFRTALTQAIRCGGDTDTVGAIVGSLAGAEVGVAGIPAEWLAGLRDWPRSAAVLKQLAHALANDARQPVKWCWPGVLPRNVFFLVVVLLHGLRRGFPPYN